MLYWIIVFFVVACGAALTFLGPAWISVNKIVWILTLGLLAALGASAPPLLRAYRKRHMRDDYDHSNRDNDRKRRVFAGNQR